jgi:two-component system invasion response regulator UvrY
MRDQPRTASLVRPPAAPGPRILLVDDHRIVRDGLRRILAEALPDATFGEAATATEALVAARSAPWDLVVLDVSLPSRSGLDVLKELRHDRPDARVLMTTMYAEDQYALRSFRAGAAGYITKDSGPDDFVAAVQKVLAGGRYVSPSLAEHLASTLGSDTGRPPHERLSDRELQVLRLLASGLSVKEIGHQLHLSDKTISTYRARVLEKLQLRTAAQLMRYAIGANLVD